MSSSGSQTSARPPAKPNVLNPIDSRATLPVRIIRSAQEIFRPYFCLIGQSSRRALSRLTLSGQLLRGAKRCAAGAGAAATVADAVRAGAVPRHANEQRPVVAEVRRPPVLRIRHQGMEVLDHGIEVEALELLRVVELPRPWDRTGASAGEESSGSADSATSLRSSGPQPLCVCERRPSLGTWLPYPFSLRSWFVFLTRSDRLTFVLSGTASF